MQPRPVSRPRPEREGGGGGSERPRGGEAGGSEPALGRGRARALTEGASGRALCGGASPPGALAPSRSSTGGLWLRDPAAAAAGAGSMRRRRPLARRIRLRHWPAAAGHRAAHVTASGRKYANWGEGAPAKLTAFVTGLRRDQKDVPERIGQGLASDRSGRWCSERMDWLPASQSGWVFRSLT